MARCNNARPVRRLRNISLALDRAAQHSDRRMLENQENRLRGICWKQKSSEIV
jgi:hypothetical protein